MEGLSIRGARETAKATYAKPHATTRKDSSSYQGRVLQNLEPGRFVLHKAGRCEHVSRQH